MREQNTLKSALSRLFGHFFHINLLFHVQSQYYQQLKQFQFFLVLKPDLKIKFLYKPVKFYKIKNNFIRYFLKKIISNEKHDHLSCFLQQFPRNILHGTIKRTDHPNSYYDFLFDCCDNVTLYFDQLLILQVDKIKSFIFAARNAFLRLQMKLFHKKVKLFCFQQIKKKTIKAKICKTSST